MKRRPDITIQFREQPAALPERATDDGVMVRYCELRYEAERTISGIALRYGDVAVIWGEKERFESGAFGDISKADVIMNMQHARDKPIARSGGGGLIVSDDGSEVAIRAELPDTQTANETLELVKKRVLRGLSIEFRPSDWRYEGKDGDRTLVIEKAELRGVAVVDRPAYPASRVDPRAEARKEDQTLDEKQVRQLIEEALAKRSDEGKPLDVDALVRAVVEAATSDREAIETGVKAQIDAAMKERDEARAAEQKTADEKREADEAAEAARKEAETQATATREAFEAEAERKADLRVTFAELYPKDYEARGKTSKELLIAAVGDEVPNAETRSEDYLEAKAEGILERKRAATTPAPTPAPTPGNDLPATPGPSGSEAWKYRNDFSTPNPTWSGASAMNGMLAQRAAENAERLAAVPA
jgi:HK97 family phage prohead protease